MKHVLILAFGFIATVLANEPATQPPVHINDPAQLVSSETNWLKACETKLTEYERSTGIKILLQFHAKSPSADEDKKPGAYMHALAKKLGVDRGGVLVVYFHDDPDWRVWIGDDLTNAFTGKPGTVQELTASEAIHEVKEAMLAAAHAKAGADIEKARTSSVDGKPLSVARGLAFQADALLDALKAKFASK